MLTLISGTNREGSSTEKLTQFISKKLSEKSVEHKTVYLHELDPSFFHSNMYAERGDQLLKTLNDKMIPSNKYLVVSPEYNGSFPGALKLFIDALPPDTFHYKTVGIIGHAGGKFGNFRGVEHLTGVFQYLRMNVLYEKPVLSGINAFLTDKGLENDDYIRQIDKLVDLISKQ
jgi:chromate reductase